MELVFDDDDKTTFRSLNKTDVADKVGLRRPSMASEEKLTKSARRSKELEHTRDSLDEFRTTLNETLTRLEGPMKHSFSPEKTVSDPGNELLFKNVTATGCQAWVAIPESKLVSLFPDKMRLTMRS